MSDSERIPVIDVSSGEKFVNDRGMKVIKDVVLNHVGISHWMIEDLPDSSWLNQWPEFQQTSYRAPTLMDPHASKYDQKNRWGCPGGLVLRPGDSMLLPQPHSVHRCVLERSSPRHWLLKPQL